MKVLQSVAKKCSISVIKMRTKVYQCVVELCNKNVHKAQQSVVKKSVVKSAKKHSHV